MYEIEWLPNGTLKMELAGFWDNALMSAFMRAIQVEIRRKPRPTFVGLCDISALLVQSPDIVLRFQELLDEVRAGGMRRGAIVVTSALLKIQAGRAVDPSRTKFVATLAEGERWIDEMRIADAVDAVSLSIASPDFDIVPPGS